MPGTAQLSAQSAQQNFPTGTVLGGWRFTVTGASSPPAQVIPDPATAPPETIVATFTGLIPGSYNASVQRQNNVGSGVGPTVTTPFVIPDPGVNLPVAGTLTVTVS